MVAVHRLHLEALPKGCTVERNRSLKQRHVENLLGRVQSPWLIPPISGVRTSSLASVGERSRETPIYQGNRCDPYNGVDLSGLELE